MDLVTVTNNVFAPCVFNLIESYRLNSSNEQVHIIYFDLEQEYVDLFKKTYGKQVNLIPVQKDCEHAFNPRFYFPKGFALKYAAQNLKTFLMCDASHAFVNKTYDLEYYIEKDTRFFIEYPGETFKNKHWCSKKSLDILECNTKEIREAQSYWSGLHGYVVNDENKQMLMDQYHSMLHKDVAGPSNLIRYPDGPKADCIGHRNDQTVLSLMIYKYGFRQPFDLSKYNRYGDLQTMQVMMPNIYSQFDLSKVAMYSRFSKGNNFYFLKSDLLKEIERISEIYKIDRNTGRTFK